MRQHRPATADHALNRVPLAKGPAPSAEERQAWPNRFAQVEIVNETSKKGRKPAPRSGGAKTTPGRNGYRYRPQFGVVVLCDNEEAQQRAFERLKRAGYERLRVVAV